MEEFLLNQDFNVPPEVSNSITRPRASSVFGSLGRGSSPGT
jgi:hypothetical protein